MWVMDRPLGPQWRGENDSISFEIRYESTFYRAPPVTASIEKMPAALVRWEGEVESYLEYCESSVQTRELLI